MSIRDSRRRFLKHGAVLGSAAFVPGLVADHVFAADPVRLRAVWWGGQDRAKRTNEATLWALSLASSMVKIAAAIRKNCAKYSSIRITPTTE